MNLPLRSFLWAFAVAGLLWPGEAGAADPSEIFLQAYQNCQTAEKLETNGNPAAAAERLRAAIKLLKQIERTDPGWQPLVVQYRLRKAQEGLDHLGIPASSTAMTEPLEGAMPEQSPQDAFRGPPVNSGPRISTTPIPNRSRPPVYSAEPRATESRSGFGQGTTSELRLLRQRLGDAEREKDRLHEELLKAHANTKAALFEVDKTKVSVVELKSRLAQTTQALENAQKDGGAMSELRQGLQGFQQKLKELEADNGVLREENERLLAKLDTASDYIKSSDKIRDGLLKDRQELSDAIAGKNLVNPAEFNQLKSENAELAARLVAAEAEKAQLAAQVRQLGQQYELANAEIARAKLNPSPSAEDQSLVAENELLRGIILRQLREQARREEARQEVEAELASLNISSDILKEQIGVLAAPSVNLTSEERALFKDPITLISESAPSSMEVVMAMAKPRESTEGPKTVPSRKLPVAGTGDLPASLLPVVEKARGDFERQRFDEAEKLYRQIARAVPSNHFVLANLGIVRLQMGKLDEARASLEKAAQLKPDDAVAYTYLGIVEDRQGNVDEAVALLQKSLQNDPEGHIAHNYLGICLGKKGDSKAAEREIKKAIELKPDYAPAYFNLAILYATSKPPSRELAKQYYAKATELGAAPDASLERLIQ